MDDLPVRRFEGHDGVRLAYREIGRGKPLVLLHGFCSSAVGNWVSAGHAAKIAARGHRVIMPDHRAHGDSAKPHDPAAYPPDVLADDCFALIETLGLTGYDLGGYSIGGRIVVRTLVRGAAPDRAVVAGIGLDLALRRAAIDDIARPVLAGRGPFEPGSPHGLLDAFLDQAGGDRVALLNVLGTLVDTPREALGRIEVPALVLIGEDDTQTDARALAEALPRGRLAMIPGDHVSLPGLAGAITDFLDP
ncbi:alpha/beta fold hydrolase [Actinomadura fulvescens]|uniref:Alpha/beta fold hydrolase n=1 Tax=Actinomadura fulvescens TaxID=46160 RepID=A0ABN3PD38_9ACTN